MPSKVDYSQMQISMSQYLKTNTKSTTLLINHIPANNNCISVLIHTIRLSLISFNLIPPTSTKFSFPCFLLYLGHTELTELVRLLGTEHTIILDCNQDPSLNNISLKYVRHRQIQRIT